MKSIGSGFLKILTILDSALHTVEKIILKWAVIIIAFMTIGNVLNRMIFGSSWFFAAEISRLCIIVATFMGISYAARKGRHISMSALFDLSPKPVKNVLATIIPLVTAIILFVLGYYAIQYTAGIYASGRTTAAIQFPFWLMVLALPVGLFLGGLQFLRNMYTNITNREVYLAQEKKDYDEQ
ncbi:TRAP transporter small permease [Alkalicoccus urumqiensis]|uniref:TRAP transporter small permease n=1 Tax=Alkalicoccus urumqiensis TaxID=1548213 RepID=A0A2P6MHC6_ALKUR|nr:TRAP transporter small permease [Alkalicoccus urumqiensis]PRO65689.1 TRAP transporter small permease [Alkalicoccus urumqiensis]